MDSRFKAQVESSSNTTPAPLNTESQTEAPNVSPTAYVLTVSDVDHTSILDLSKLPKQASPRALSVITASSFFLNNVNSPDMPKAPNVTPIEETVRRLSLGSRSER